MTLFRVGSPLPGAPADSLTLEGVTLASAGAPLPLPRVGEYLAAEGGPHHALLPPLAESSERDDDAARGDDDLALFEPEGIHSDHLFTSGLIAAALLLLGLEWWLVRRGRMP